MEECKYDVNQYCPSIKVEQGNHGEVITHECWQERHHDDPHKCTGCGEEW